MRPPVSVALVFAFDQVVPSFEVQAPKVGWPPAPPRPAASNVPLLLVNRSIPSPVGPPNTAASLLTSVQAVPSGDVHNAASSDWPVFVEPAATSPCSVTATVEADW